ncbi:MAG: delta-60 repeat domain-containing protein, partial [bacterium]|nr:delta-60 repeat domain-containing protein [bacterium]
MAPMRFRYYCLFLVFILGFLPQDSQAGALGAGELDPSFDNDGLVQTAIDVSSNIRGLALQADGKIVAVGITTLNGNDFVVARYNTDGSLDGSFGAGGIVTTDFSGMDFSDSASSVLILNDGKILVGGAAGAPNSHTNFALARYNPDGSLDPSFGTGGLVSFDFLGVEANDEILSIALQADGKIVAAGITNMDRGVAENLFAIARFNPDGSVDTGFANNGTFTTDFGGGVMSSSTARKVLIRPTGAILVGGDSDAGGTRDAALLQLDGSGNPDGNFGTNGMALTDLGNSELGRSLALLP